MNTTRKLLSATLAVSAALALSAAPAGASPRWNTIIKAIGGIHPSQMLGAGNYRLIFSPLRPGTHVMAMPPMSGGFYGITGQVTCSAVSGGAPYEALGIQVVRQALPAYYPFTVPSGFSRCSVAAGVTTRKGVATVTLQAQPSPNPHKSAPSTTTPTTAPFTPGAPLPA